MFKLRFATLISRLFDPTWLVSGMLSLAVIWSLYNGLRWRFILILFLVDGIIPFAYFVHLLRTHEISDWDTTKRPERFRLYAFVLVVHAVGVLLALVLGKIILAKILFSFWTLALAFSVVTLFWKISIHTGVSSAAVAFLIIIFGPQMFWLYPLVIVIAWARVALHKHTPSQALAGLLLASILLFLMFSILKIDSRKAGAPSEQGYFVHE